MIVVTATLLALCLAIDNRLVLGPVSFTVGEAGAALFAFSAALKRNVGKWEIGRGQFALVGLCLASAAVAILRDPDTLHAFSALRDVLAPVVLYWAIRSANLKERHRAWIIECYLVGVLVASSVAVAQFFFGFQYPLERSVDAAWVTGKTEALRDYFVARWLGLRTIATGTYAQPNVLGEFLAGGITLMLGMVILGREHVWRRRALIGLVAFVGLALLTSFARTAMVLCFIAMALLLHARRCQLRLDVLVVCAVLIGIAASLVLETGVPHGRAIASVFGRGQTISTSIRMILERPDTLLGGATSAYLKEYYLRGQVVHNSILYLSLQFGIFFAAAYYALALRAVHECFTASVRNAGQPTSVLPTTAGVFGFCMLCLYSQTAPYLDSVQSGLNLAFILAVGAVPSRDANSSKAGW